MRPFYWIQGVPFLLLIALSNYASGQWISDYCKIKADSLEKSGIDTIIYYRPYFGPMTVETTDCCMVYERQYLLWKNKERLFIVQYYEYYNIDKDTRGKSINECTLMDTLNLFKYLKEHFQQVVTDTLLPAKLRIVKDGEELIRDYANLYVSDDDYTSITVLVGNKTYSNGYNGNYLNDGKNLNPDGTLREQWESINYEKNMTKAVYQLISRIERQVAVFGKF